MKSKVEQIRELKARLVFCHALATEDKTGLEIFFRETGMQSDRCMNLVMACPVVRSVRSLLEEVQALRLLQSGGVKPEFAPEPLSGPILLDAAGKLAGHEKSYPADWSPERIARQKVVDAVPQPRPKLSIHLPV